MRVGLLASHPVQYQVPWFRALAREIDLTVYFAHKPSAVEQAVGFGGAFEWDIELYGNYRHSFLANNSRRPGTNNFFGCNTPSIDQIISSKGFAAFIVSGWNLLSFWQAVRACRRNKVPVMVRGDSQLNRNTRLAKRALKQITHRILIRQFDGFLSVGRRNREYLLHYGVPEEKIFFVPHFVDNDRFAAQANAIRGQRSKIRRQWKIPDNAFCALFCGKFIPKKRPMDLIRAAQSLLTHHPSLNLHLLFVGSGQLGEELRRNCHVIFDEEKSGLISDSGSLTSGTKPPASFTGFLNQTEISRAYVAADCLVLPSDSGETWGLVVNEAMASGIPAIVSDAVGCGPDLVDNGATGFTFAVGKPSELAANLKMVTDRLLGRSDLDSVLYQKLRAYSVETAVEGTLTALQSVTISR